MITILEEKEIQRYTYKTVCDQCGNVQQEDHDSQYSRNFKNAKLVCGVCVKMSPFPITPGYIQQGHSGGGVGDGFIHCGGGRGVGDGSQRAETQYLIFQTYDDVAQNLMTNYPNLPANITSQNTQTNTDNQNVQQEQPNINTPHSNLDQARDNI